jgi:hypothetical protein
MEARGFILGEIQGSQFHPTPSTETPSPQKNGGRRHDHDGNKECKSCAVHAGRVLSSERPHREAQTQDDPENAIGLRGKCEHDPSSIDERPLLGRQFGRKPSKELKGRCSGIGDLNR